MLNKLDQKLIDFLTMICWWTEVRWEKDNLYFSLQTHLLGNFFNLCSFFLIYQEIINIDKYENLSVLLIVVMVYFGFIFFFVLIFFEMMKKEVLPRRFPQGTPNPCRIINSQILIRKIFVCFLPCVTFYLGTSAFIVTSLDRIIALLFYFSFLSSGLYMYLLACDSIPPQERQKRREKIEIESGKLQTADVSSN